MSDNIKNPTRQWFEDQTDERLESLKKMVDAHPLQVRLIEAHEKGNVFNIDILKGLIKEINEGTGDESLDFQYYKDGLWYIKAKYPDKWKDQQSYNKKNNLF